MRNLQSLIFCLSITGCSTVTTMNSPLENCDLLPEWHILNAPPENATELIELLNDDQLRSHNARGRNHYWLSIDVNSYAFCSQPSRTKTACSGSEVNFFRNNSGQWSKDPLTQLTLCH